MKITANNAAGVEGAVKGLSKPDAFIMLVGNKDDFKSNVDKLKELFPDVPSVACVANGYTDRMCEKAVTVMAFFGADIRSGVLDNVSKSPVKSIEAMEKKIRSLNPGRDNTACIDFCTGNDAMALSTMHSLLSRHNIDLMGGTGDAGMVAVDGTIYQDADAYLLVKNPSGKARVYKENLYQPMGDAQFVASDTDPSRYYVGKLNGRPATEVYEKTFGIDKKDVTMQGFTNPLGKLTGKDICIISMKDVEGEGITCYRQINDSDVLTLLELKDFREVSQETINRINSDFKHISAVFSVNCAFRYLYFNQNNSMNEYLGIMGKLNGHCGYVGFGEHYNNQFINQSMTCVVFE